MRKIIVIFLVIIFIFRCSEQSDSIIPPDNENPIKEINSLDYYFISEAENAFLIVLENHNYIGGEVFLDAKKDSLIGKFENTNIEGYSKTAALVTYPNLSNPIDLQFNLKKSNNDTIYQYSIQNYQHEFVSTFEVSKISDYTEGSFILDKSISPDRSRLFYIEYFSVPQKYILKSIDLNNYQVYTLNENFKPSTSLYGVNEIQAVSSTEIITKTILYNYQPGSDTADVCRYNINNRQFVRVSYMSDNYSSMSSVVNNHILFGKPTGGNQSAYVAYNVLNNSQTETPGYYYLFNKRTDNIWYSNAYYDEVTKQFVELSYDPSEYYVYFYDRNSKFTITSQWVLPITPPYQHKLKLFRNTQLLFEDNLTTKKDIFFIDGAPSSEDKIYVFIRFSDLRDKSKEGYYEINISSNTINLVHNSSQLGSAYWTNQNEFVVFQYDGIYKYKIPN